MKQDEAPSKDELRRELEKLIAREHYLLRGLQDAMRAGSRISDPWEKAFFRELLTPAIEILGDTRQNITRLKSLVVSHGVKDPGGIVKLDIERAKQVPIASLLDTKVQRSGKYQVALCPLHNEKTPSFTIYPDNHYWCFGCQQGGDSIELIREPYDFNFVEAVGFLLTYQNQN